MRQINFIILLLFTIIHSFAQEASEREIVVRGNDLGDASEEPGGYGQPEWVDRSRASVTTKLYVLNPFEVFVGVRSESDLLRHRKFVHDLTQEFEIGLPYRIELDLENEVTAAGTRLAESGTSIGVRYVFGERGTGPLPRPGQRVSARYTGFLPDGHIFDASEAQGGLLKFRLGRHEVVAGLDEVMLLLPVGSRVRVWIPAALGYAAKGVRYSDDDDRYLIPPGTPLVFELEIVGVR